MWFKLDIPKFTTSLIPIDLRKVKLVGLVQALVAPLVEINDTWRRMRSDNLYKLEHTGQVCYLRGALNDRFDPSERRITIDGTGGNSEPTYIYTPGENQTKELFGVCRYRSGLHGSRAA